jgi:hypothetical protein
VATIEKLIHVKDCTGSPPENSFLDVRWGDALLASQRGCSTILHNQIERLDANSQRRPQGEDE